MLQIMVSLIRLSQPLRKRKKITVLIVSEKERKSVRGSGLERKRKKKIEKLKRTKSGRIENKLKNSKARIDLH